MKLEVEILLQALRKADRGEFSIYFYRLLESDDDAVRETAFRYLSEIDNRKSLVITTDEQATLLEATDIFTAGASVCNVFYLNGLALAHNRNFYLNPFFKSKDTDQSIIQRYIAEHMEQMRLRSQIGQINELAVWPGYMNSAEAGVFLENTLKTMYPQADIMMASPGKYFHWLMRTDMQSPETSQAVVLNLNTHKTYPMFGRH